MLGSDPFFWKNLAENFGCHDVRSSNAHAQVPPRNLNASLSHARVPSSRIPYPRARAYLVESERNQSCDNSAMKQVQDGKFVDSSSSHRKKNFECSTISNHGHGVLAKPTHLIFRPLSNDEIYVGLHVFVRSADETQKALEGSSTTPWVPGMQQVCGGCHEGIVLFHQKDTGLVDVEFPGGCRWLFPISVLQVITRAPLEDEHGRIQQFGVHQIPHAMTSRALARAMPNLNDENRLNGMNSNLTSCICLDKTISPNETNWIRTMHHGHLAQKAFEYELIYMEERTLVLQQEIHARLLLLRLGMDLFARSRSCGADHTPGVRTLYPSSQNDPNSILNRGFLRNPPAMDSLAALDCHHALNKPLVSEPMFLVGDMVRLREYPYTREIMNARARRTGALHQPLDDALAEYCGLGPLAVIKEIHSDKTNVTGTGGLSALIQFLDYKEFIVPTSCLIHAHELPNTTTECKTLKSKT